MFPTPLEHYYNRRFLSLIIFCFCFISEDDGEEKFTWSYQSVLTLMSLFKQYKDKFESPEMKKKNVWREISKKMQEQGYIISPEQCDKKWRNLRCTYKAVLVKKTMNPSHKKTWEFFNEMHDICQEDPNLTEATNPLTGTPLGYGSKVINTSSIPQSLPLYQLVQSCPGTSILKRTVADNNFANLAPKKRKTAILTSGQGGNESNEVVVLSEPRSTPGIEPQWFAIFRQEMRRDNERNMAEIKAMHSESLKLLRDRNDILKTLISLLDPANNNNAKKKNE